MRANQKDRLIGRKKELTVSFANFALEHGP